MYGKNGIYSGVNEEKNALRFSHSLEYKNSTNSYWALTSQGFTFYALGYP